ncbi:hypothetical protein [Kitasatospora sp. NPDC051705]|uniref:hypothetical protein n=1 Tax=Kitasatospora sp. NPDC051705 TaxID=3364057 RepID=UPI0037B2A879
MADGARQRPSGGADDGFSAEERAVRDLMRRAVADIQPEPGGLPRIRYAVPRRRAARRGAWTGAAALALAVAIALPALHDGEHLGLSGGPGSADAKSPAATAPTGTRTGGTTGSGTPPRTGPGSGTSDTAPPSGTPTASPSSGSTTTRADGTTTAPAPATSTGDSPITPLCTRADLGQGSAQTGPADSDGRITGSFTVLNVSDHSCRLGGPGAVAVTSVTGIDRGRVRTADRTAGDPAVTLPAMDAEPPVLAPQAGYRVPFTWIPDRTGCPTRGSGTATTTPAGQGGANPVAAGTPAPAATGAAPGSGASGAPSVGPPASSSPSAGPTTVPSPTATATAGPTTAPAGATIAHTPAPGSPAAATVTLPVGCGGTFYRGGVQAAGGAAAPQPSGSPAAG